MSAGYYKGKSSLEKGPPILGRIVSRGTAGMDQILAVMNFQKLSVGIAVTLAVLEDFFKAIEYLLLEGYTINTPYFSARLVMKGGFESMDSPYVEGVQSVVITMQPGVHMQDLLNHLVLNLIDQPVTLPQPAHYIDAASGQEDVVVRANSMGRLKGNNLKFDPSDPEQGIFALNGQGWEKISILGPCTDSELWFTTTMMENMDHVTFEVRTRTSPKADLRIGRLPVTLAVQQQAVVA